MLKTILIFFFFIGGQVFCQDLEVLTFYPDDNEKTIVMPSENCSPYIDDNSNYKLEPKNGASIKIVGLGQSDRSASLLVDCATGSLIFSLNYVSRSVKSFEDDGSRVVRPQSSVSVNTKINNPDFRGVGLEISDRSFEKLQITIRNDFETFLGSPQRVDSFDFLHKLDELYFSYGYQQNQNLDDTLRIYRANSGYAGVNISHASSISRHSGWINDATWIRFPYPIGLGYGYERKASGAQSQTFDRYFLSRWGAFTASLTTRYVRRILENRTRTDAYQLRVEQDYRANGGVRLANLNRLSCETLRNCKINEWTLKTNLSFSGISLGMEYGLLPHSFSASLNSIFWQRQKFTMALRKKFSERSFVSRWRQFAVDSQEPSTTENSNVHFELVRQKWTYFYDQSSSLIRKSVLSNSIGCKFEGDSLTTGLGARMDGLDAKRVGYFGDVRYFFDQNLARTALHWSKTSVKVKVKSNAPGLAVVGAKVDLFLDGKLIASRVSSPDGVVEFTEGRCCQDYRVVATFGGMSGEADVYLSAMGLDRLVSVVINDHKKASVNFYVKINERLERLNLGNFYDEINEATVACDKCIYAGNYVYVPITGLTEMRINQSLLPFNYGFLEMQGGNFDTRDPGVQAVNLILSVKGK